MYNKKFVFIIISVLLGCTEPKYRRPVGKYTDNIKFLNISNKKYNSVVEGDFLKLTDAFILVIKNNPLLRTESFKLKLAAANRILSNVSPNPVIKIEVENIMGTKGLKYLSGTEATFSIGKVFELGNKRLKRMEISDKSYDVAKLRFSIKKRSLLLATALNYLDIMYLTHEVEVNERIKKLFIKTEEIFKNKINVGKLSPLQLSKYEILLKLKKMHWKQTKFNLIQAKNRLAAKWGSTEAKFKKIESCFYWSKKLPRYDSLVSSINKNPLIKLEKALSNLKLSQYSLSKTISTPNINLEAGVRYFQDSQGVAAVIGVEVPIPVFNKGKGEMMAAEISINQQKSNSLRSVFRLKTSLKSEYLNLKNQHKMITILIAHLKETEKTLKKIVEGYKLGKFSYLEVIDSQRLLIELYRSFHAHLLSYTKSEVKISFLTGKQLFHSLKNNYLYCTGLKK